MPKCIAKLGEDQYVEWSTVVDAPVTYIMGREAMADYLREEYGRARADQIPERLARADRVGHSALWPGAGESIETLIAGNHAGPEGSEATLAEIRERFADPEEDDP